MVSSVNGTNYDKFLLFGSPYVTNMKQFCYEVVMRLSWDVCHRPTGAGVFPPTMKFSHLWMDLDGLIFLSFVVGWYRFVSIGGVRPSKSVCVCF